MRARLGALRAPDHPPGRGLFFTGPYRDFIPATG